MRYPERSHNFGTVTGWFSTFSQKVGNIREDIKMPRRNEWEEQRQASPEYKQAAMQTKERVQKQGDVYDKLWYGILYQGYVAAVSAKDRDRKEQEKQKLRERYAAAGQPLDESKLEDEFDAIDDQYDPEMLMSNDLTGPMEDAIMDDLFHFSTVEDQRVIYQQMGVVNARAAYEAGKEYQKWLNSDLLKDDPDKEAKAEYLARNMCSKAQYIMLGCNTLQFSLNSSLQQNAANFNNSFLADRNAFRKMTMHDFCRQTFMNEEQTEEYLQELRARGHEVDLDSNAYAFFEGVCRKKKGAEEQKIAEDEVLDEAFKAYNQKAAMYYQNIGMDVVQRNLPQEEQNAFGVGVLLINNRDYRAPKNIHEWIQNVADPLIAAGNTEGIQTAYEELKSDVSTDVAFEVVKSEPLSYAFGRTDAPAKGYQDYIRENLGVDVLNSSFEEQRMHVARAMAADALRESRIPFHVETILTRADEFLRSERFAKLSNREISELVAGGPDNLKKFRRDLMNETYAMDGYAQENGEPDRSAETIESLQEKLAGRERAVSALVDRKQRTELYTQSLDKLVAQAKRYQETLKKLAAHKSENSEEFQNMEHALDEVAKMNKNMSPLQIEGLMTQLGAMAGAYRERIDGSWHRGILGNGRERRNLAESIGYFAVSQKGALQTLGKSVMAPETGISRQLLALDSQIGEARQEVAEAKAELENAETEAAIRAVGEVEAKEAIEQSFEKVQQAANREEAYRRSLDPKAADYQEKLIQSAEHSLFIQASVDACKRSAENLGAKKSAQILNSTMDKLLKAPDGNSVSFRAFKAEFLDKKLFNEHFAELVMRSAEQGKLSGADMAGCRDEALKASFADRRADAKSLNKLSAVLGSKVNAKTAGIKVPGNNKVAEGKKAETGKKPAPGR